MCGNSHTVTHRACMASLLSPAPQRDHCPFHAKCVCLCPHLCMSVMNRSVVSHMQLLPSVLSVSPCSLLSVCQPWAHNALLHIYDMPHIYLHIYHCTPVQMRLHNLTLFLSAQLFELRINRLTATAAGSGPQLDITDISSRDRSLRLCSHASAVSLPLRDRVVTC